MEFSCMYWTTTGDLLRIDINHHKTILPAGFLRNILEESAAESRRFWMQDKHRREETVMTDMVSRRGLLQAATALGISTVAGGLDPADALAQEARGGGPAEYYNKQGQVVLIAPGLQLGYRDDWLGEPWEMPDVMLMIHGNIESGVVWFGWVPRLGPEYRLR